MKGIIAAKIASSLSLKSTAPTEGAFELNGDVLFYFNFKKGRQGRKRSARARTRNQSIVEIVCFFNALGIFLQKKGKFF